MHLPPFVPATNHLPGYGSTQGERNNPPAKSSQISEMHDQRNRQVGQKQPGERKLFK